MELKKKHFDEDILNKMDDIVVKICVNCDTEKRFDKFYNKHSECKPCKIIGISKRYYNNKDEILQKRQDQHARLKNLHIDLNALEGKLSIC